jgi:PAS domain S-box-containing protein
VTLASLGVAVSGRVVRWSPSAAELFGRKDADVLGRDLCDAVMDGDHRKAVQAAVDGAAAGTASAEVLRTRLAGGERVPVEFRWEPMTDVAGRVTVGVAALPRVGDGGPPLATEDQPLADPLGLSIGATLDVRQTAHELAAALTSRLCYAAGVYLLESLLVDDQLPSYEAVESRVVVRRIALRAADARPEWTTVFPADEVIAYAADTTIARCMSLARSMIFTTLDTQTISRLKERLAGRPHIDEVLSYDSFLAVPLIARGNVLGFALLARRPGARPFIEAEARLARRLADHAAVCMDNGRLYDRERRTSRTLQHSLLPVALKPPPGMRIAHRYLPAGRTSRIGGDWYDAIPLPGGKVALVVGDAMGHGTTAALVMGQLRTAVRILARLGLPPAELLHHLDDVAQELTTAQFATCVYALCDPAGRQLTVARAGHVPPVLAAPDGSSRLIDLPPGLPLGVGAADYEAVEVELPEHATLILCTDGLVESRTRDMDTGLAELRAVLASAPPDPELTCDTIVEHLHSGTGADDATLLLARLDPGASPPQARPRPGGRRPHG